jgi:predicted ATPase/class 3 adenylate cyclase/predicted nucleic acid-binding protein
MSLPAGTVTFLFTDIEESTQRWERYRDRMREVVESHESLVRAAVAECGGTTFKNVGDGICAVFWKAPDAVAAAIQAQRALAGADFSAVEGLRVRMGAHAGSARPTDGDYLGPAVNHAARVGALAHGEQIVVSRVVADLAEGELPDGVVLRDLGAHRLKGIAAPERLYQVVVPGLRADFPAITDAEEPANNLPQPLASIIGRDADVAAISETLTESRLVTIAGSGGIGKSAVALLVARERLRAYADGAWLVELAPLADASLIAGAVAAALRIDTAIASSRPTPEEIAPLLARRELLLVLDNCEHVIAAAARVAQQLLAGCPGLRILATSRERLGITGERTYQLSPLGFPSSERICAEAAGEYAAVRLFVERAQAFDRSFALTAGNAPAIVQIVRRLDGIPLAIELAAARVRLLSCQRIAEGLNDRFELLAGGSRTAMPRQRTLRALIAWSYDLLEEHERRLFRRLAVFRGGWTLEATQAVCADNGSSDWESLSALSSLADKSLLNEEMLDGEKRLRMFESTAAFAAEVLERSGETETTARRHCAWFARESAAALDAYYRTNLQAWHARVLRELDNYRAAIDWALTRQRDIELGARMAAALSASTAPERRELVEQAACCEDQLCELTQAFVQLARARVAGPPGHAAAAAAAEAFARAGEAVWQSEALIFSGGAAWHRGNVTEAIQHGQAALELAQRLELPRLSAGVLNSLGIWTAYAGDREAGTQLVQRAAALYETLDDRARLVTPLINLGELLFAAGDAQAALERAHQALELAREVGHEPAAVTCHNNIAAYALACGRVGAARSHVADALQAATTLRETWSRIVALEHAAAIAASTDDPQTAARLIGCCDAAMVRFGCVREETEERGYRELTGVLERRFGRERLRALMAEGARLDDAVAGELALRAVRGPCTFGG